VLERLVPGDLVLCRELAELIDRLGLQIGQVHARVIGIRGEWTREDRGVLPGGVIVPSAWGIAAALLPLWRPARGGVLAASGAATLLLRSRVVVHGRLACQQCFM
jgi:hypothetical protein